MSAAKRPRCGHRVERAGLSVGSVALTGGQPQACGEHASQRIVTPAAIVFRCSAHEVAPSESVRVFAVESAA